MPPRRESQGEAIIRSFLQRRDVTFQQNYAIQADGCVGPYRVTGRLFIDFVVFRDPAALNVIDPVERNAYIVCAIEYDGHGSHFDNAKQMSRDRLKTHWCHQHNIPLRRFTCEPAQRNEAHIERIVEHFLTHPYGAYREAASEATPLGCPCTPREKYGDSQAWYDLQPDTSVPRPFAPREFLLSEIGDEPRAIALKAERERWAIVEYVPHVSWGQMWRWLKTNTWRAWLWTYRQGKALVNTVRRA